MVNSIFNIFRTRNQSDPLLNPRSISAWLKQLSDADPFRALKAIDGILEDFAANRPRATANRAAALIELDRHAATLQERLVGDALAAMSSDLRLHVWDACDDVARRFAQCYEQLCDTLPQQAKTRELVLPCIARMFFCRSVQAKLSLFRYEQWIPGRWHSLHELFKRAREREHKLKLSTLDDGAEVPGAAAAEQGYIQVLLLERLNTGDFTPLEIEWASQWLRQWTKHLTLSRARTASRCFALDLAGTRGLQYGETVTEGDQVLYLDTHPLLEQIRLVGERDEQRAFLERLDRAWSPYVRALPRRGERQAIRRYVIVEAGLSNICAAIQRQRARLEFDRQLFGRADAAQLQTDDYVRVSPQTAFEEIEYRPEGWRVLDLSESGCRIVRTGKESAVQALGTLIGVREEGTKQWKIGVVRRLKRLASDETEFGVEIIARHAVPLKLRPPDGRKTGYSVNGIAVQPWGETFDALYLQALPPAGNGLVRSLVMPARWFEPSRLLVLGGAKTEYTIRLDGLLEKQQDWIWIQFDAADATRNNSGQREPRPRPKHVRAVRNQ